MRAYENLCDIDNIIDITDKFDNWKEKMQNGDIHDYKKEKIILKSFALEKLETFEKVN